MNDKSTFEVLLGLILQNPNFTKIRMSHADYFNIINDQKTRYLLVINNDSNGAATGLMAHLFGKEIYISPQVVASTIEVYIESTGKWSVPIEFDQIVNIKKIVKLQAFW